ncbi:MAG: imidazole glycerol phosphate synthase subunit HisH, partial [Rhodoferax sp.]|nr:imidazole glycerol phosphate synthase subunit HisH [Rhodoferax sp.]
MAAGNSSSSAVKGPIVVVDYGIVFYRDAISANMYCMIIRAGNTVVREDKVFRGRIVPIVIGGNGIGNLRSVWQALVHVAQGREVIVSADPMQLAAAERVVFPGQGAMPDCMRELEARGLREAVLEAAHNKPFLGICIGLQMLFEHSEEGDVPGLGIFQGQVRRFPADKMVGADGHKLKVPHMGWNELFVQQKSPLFKGMNEAFYLYFVHSFHAVCDDK